MGGGTPRDSASQLLAPQTVPVSVLLCGTMSINKLRTKAEGFVTQLTAKDECEKRVLDALSNNKHAPPRSLLNELAEDTFSHERCGFGCGTCVWDGEGVVWGCLGWQRRQEQTTSHGRPAQIICYTHRETEESLVYVFFGTLPPAPAPVRLLPEIDLSLTLCLVRCSIFSCFSHP